jgi:hypothetical protein
MGVVSQNETKVENHRHIVAEMPNPLMTKLISRDDDGGARASTCQPYDRDPPR